MANYYELSSGITRCFFEHHDGVLSSVSGKDWGKQKEGEIERIRDGKVSECLVEVIGSE